MLDLFGNHIVGFPTRRLTYFAVSQCGLLNRVEYSFHSNHNISAEGALPSWLTGGLLECTRLRDSYNENVLPLLGISIDDKRVYILYPEMSNRSLKEYMNSVSRVCVLCWKI